MEYRRKSRLTAYDIHNIFERRCIAEYNEDRVHGRFSTWHFLWSGLLNLIAPCCQKKQKVASIVLLHGRKSSS